MWVSKELYDKIPRVEILKAMPVKKLIKYAWNKYGIVYYPEISGDKSELIDDILFCEKSLDKLGR